MNIHKKKEEERKKEKERRPWTFTPRSAYGSISIHGSASSIYGRISPGKEQRNRHKRKAEAQQNQLIEVPKYRIKTVKKDPFPQTMETPLRLSEEEVEECHDRVPKEIGKDIGKCPRL